LYHDLDVSLDEVMDACNIDEEGMTNRGLSIAARSIGFKTKWVKFSMTALRKEIEAGRPVIVTRFDVSSEPHFSVARGTDDEFIYFCDPSPWARHRMSIRESDDSLEDRMLILVPKP
jgi:ABC-type bacteriocin/lantibiotic exporter with double-glycine peptidase domain